MLWCVAVGSTSVGGVYVATLDNTVVVTNSPVQLARIISVFRGKAPALASLDEFTFFRHRYPLGDAQETALLILSDKTIRRWCSPRWRIGSSRRTRAAALMAEMQAAHLDSLVKGEVTAGPIHTAFPLPDAGGFTLAPEGVRSSDYGTLEFLTPIVELDFTHVTKREAEFYNRWRTGYERNWTNFFDPIAVRFHAGDEKLAVDVTVMPLIEFSDYRQLVGISQGAKIASDAGDPHEAALIHAAFALNTKSAMVSQGATFLAAMVRVNPIGWIGQTVAVYADADPFWAEVGKLKDPKEMENFFEKNVYRLPVAVNVDVSSTLKLTAFLAGLRAFIEQSAPGMVVWETKQYKQQAYVKVSPSETAKSGEAWDKMSIYYAPSSDGLTVSISEAVLKRAIDRQIARREAKKAGTPAPRTGMPWLGENLCVTVDEKFIQLLRAGIADGYQQQMQRMAWGNLAVLNEWRRRFPDADPVKLHEQFWQRRLICPGGGTYRFNEKWQTMESTVYGCPGDPKQGVSLPAALSTVGSANFGLTFEEDGLRAKVQLQQGTAK